MCELIDTIIAHLYYLPSHFHQLYLKIIRRQTGHFICNFAGFIT
jgi:hypothetical protein